MQSKRIIILGAGIVGLTTAYELIKTKKIKPENLTIISKETNLTTNPGLHYLHENSRIKDLIKFLNLRADVRPVNGCWITEDGYHKSFTNQEDDIWWAQEVLDAIKAHHLKTRGTPWNGSARTMNSLLQRIIEKTLEVKFYCGIDELSISLTKALSEAGVSFYFGDIDNINIVDKEIMQLSSEFNTPTYIEYDYLINTIPLKDFILLCINSGCLLEQIFFDCYKNLKSSEIHVVMDPVIEPEICFDYVYNPFNKGGFWYRFSQRIVGTKAITQYEFSDYSRALEFAKINGIERSAIKTVKYGHIWCEDSSVKINIQAFLKGNNILLVGRNGAWNSGTLVHQSMEEAEGCANWITQK